MYSFNQYFDKCVVKTINKIVVQLKRTFQNNSDELITDERLVIYFGTCSIPKKTKIFFHKNIYRVIHKSLRNFRTRLRNNQDRHDRKEHINR